MAGEWRKWTVVVATIWIQAFTGTNLDFAAYSSALKESLSVSQEALNYLATASDLGKALGWSSGLALRCLPLPAVLLLSALLGLAAYAFQWLLLTSLLSPPSPYLMVFLASLVAGCSICWFNTVCFVLCTRYFAVSNRPLALSLSISFNGVSAALYTLFANALSPSPSVYLLLNAVLPLVVSVAALLPILLWQAPASLLNTHERDRRIFLALYVVAFASGIYLLVLSSLPPTTAGATAWTVLAGAMLLLTLPLVVTIYSSCLIMDALTPDSPLALSHDDGQKPLLNLRYHRSESYGARQQPKNLLYGCCCAAMEKSPVAVLGEEHTADKLVRRVDFWLYYMAYFCGATVGLVYSNNLGQIAQSLHHQSQLTKLLAVYSSCSFFGRLLSAVPDFLRRKVFFPRTGCLAAAMVPMPVAFFLLWKLHDEYTLTVGTALISLSSGFIFAAAVSVTAELFGANSISVNHNILITNIPLGSLLYGQIAAMVYDANGRQMVFLDARTGMPDTMVVCMGARCYATTFFMWGCISLVGLALSIVLFWRTRSAYALSVFRSPSPCVDLTSTS